MPERKKKSAKARPPQKKRAAKTVAPVKGSIGPEPKLRVGLPAQDSIISETTFVSPKGRVYRIIKTNEMDAYDDEPQPARKKRHRSPRR